MTTNSFAHHCVLPHQHNSLPTQGHSDLLHLLGAHVVCSHNETFWVIIQQLLQQEKHCNYTKKSRQHAYQHQTLDMLKTKKETLCQRSESAQLEPTLGAKAVPFTPLTSQTP